MQLPLSARKSNNYRYCDSWKCDNFRDSNQEKKQRTDTINEVMKIKSDNFTISNTEKSNIAIVILEQLIIEWHHNYFIYWWYQ